MTRDNNDASTDDHSTHQSGRTPSASPICSPKWHALAAHQLGANVIPLKDFRPLSAYQDWLNRRQTRQDLDTLPWDKANGVALVNGFDGWRTLVTRGRQAEKILGALGLPEAYRWTIRYRDRIYICFRSASSRAASREDALDVIQRVLSDLLQTQHPRFELHWATTPTSLPPSRQQHDDHDPCEYLFGVPESRPAFLHFSTPDTVEASVTKSEAQAVSQNFVTTEKATPETESGKEEGNKAQTINSTSNFRGVAIEPAQWPDGPEKTPAQIRSLIGDVDEEERPGDRPAIPRRPDGPGLTDDAEAQTQRPDSAASESRGTEGSDNHLEGQDLEAGTAETDQEMSELESEKGEVAAKRSPDAVLLFSETLGRDVRAPYIPVPKAFRERVTEWNHLLKEHAGLMAFFQLVLFGRRDGERGGIVADQGTVRDSFGAKSWEDISAGALIGMYRKLVDENLDVLHWSRTQGRAREIKAHGTPRDIVEMAKQFMSAPEEFTEWVHLINGRSANALNRQAVAQQRADQIEAADPAIDPPPATRKVQRYLNGLPERAFTTVKKRVPDAVAEVRKRTDLFGDVEKRQAALSRLHLIREYPKPLYVPCDYSARLTSYGENQLLTLKRELRPPLYTERDVELDLSKAHLAILAKLGREAGLDVSTIERYLRGQRDGKFDIWDRLAGVIQVDNVEAARKAVKRIYAAVYGASPGELLRQVSNEYQDHTGSGVHPGFDPFHPLLKHELVREVSWVHLGLVQKIIRSRVMLDAAGRTLSLSDFSSRPNPAKSLLAYVASTYEIKLIEAAFDEAIQEEPWAAEKDNRRVRFRIWLLQYDGFTMRVKRARDMEKFVKQLQDAVSAQARELGIITSLDRA